MRDVVRAVLLILAAGWVVAAGAAQELSVAYSADFVFETEDAAQTGKIYAAPGKERRDGSADGVTIITIRRDDLGKIWMLMPSERMYMEFKTDSADPSGARPANPGDYAVEMTVAGPEEVEGMRTVKHRVIMTDTDGSKMGGFWWITAEGIPMKMDMLAVEDGDKTRLKQALSNVVIGPQAAELFEIPRGYSSLSMGFGAGLGKGMFGMPADDEGEAEDDPAQGQSNKGFGLGRIKDAIN